ncbi:5-methyltetrahydropteroyltriglutamate--homocysteine methyltransferase [Nocardia farcinica]|nr:5-methyltetrahydropteroyltriglutamate--homocysteine methyltransferase [Nocardia farcinica]PFX10623.1 5-methyltetrahydropteroyltriglutamate--homocysteine methyltransferase [Nocardia farcinica]
MLDTAVLLGALPERVRGIDDELDRCFAAARGAKVVSAERLWVNSDCGLENRGTEEVLASLRDLVAAAAVVRRSCA